MSNTPRFLGALLLSLLCYRLYNLFVIEPPKVVAIPCHDCGPLLWYHECLEKRAVLGSFIPAEYAESYMGCERILPERLEIEKFTHCSDCVLWRHHDTTQHPWILPGVPHE